MLLTDNSLFALLSFEDDSEMGFSEDDGREDDGGREDGVNRPRFGGVASGAGEEPGFRLRSVTCAASADVRRVIWTTVAGIFT